MQQLFVYGTLLFPQIIEKLTGKKFKTSPGVIRGYIRRRIIGSDYPAVAESLNSEVNGLLIHEVDDQTMQILSFYEGNEYKKMEMEVWIENEKVTAFVFVWKNNLDELEETDWDENEFRQKNLNVYLNKVIPETLKEYRNSGSGF